MNDSIVYPVAKNDNWYVWPVRGGVFDVTIKLWLQSGKIEA